MRAPAARRDRLGGYVRTNTVLRVVDLDPEDRFIDPTKPVILSAFNEVTKQSGFMRDRLGVIAAPETLLMEDAAWRLLGKARRSEDCCSRAAPTASFPDLRVGTSVAQTTRISDVNPQQKEVSWGTQRAGAVAIDGRTARCRGFCSSRKDSIRRRSTRWSPTSTNHSVTACTPMSRRVAATRSIRRSTRSLGYLVFFPDIAYQDGYPGASALKSIVPGIQSLIARGFVDPKRIGTAGQSWGGYQTAYMITQTNLFAAAFAGAPVANMTSAYGGIRWESGVARAFQYEKTQSRIGGSMWQYPMRFIENSPLFYTDRIQTPVLIMSNDADGAVPWYQGIEWFVALKSIRQGSVSAELQQRRAQPAETREPEGCRSPDAGVFRPPSEGRTESRLDAQRNSVPGERARSARRNGVACHRRATVIQAVGVSV